MNNNKIIVESTGAWDGYSLKSYLVGFAVLFGIVRQQVILWPARRRARVRR